MCAMDRSDPLYNSIGGGYSRLRKTEPRIAARIWAALGDAETVLNIGAGTGSYEPPARDVTAVEPSEVMRQQRPAGAAPVIAAFAEALPFPDQSFDAAMAVLSDHHWSDPLAGLREMRRVARRTVVFQWDSERVPDFWLVRDYLPEFASFCFAGPSIQARADVLGARAEPVPIPWDCTDGFFHAYWRRPSAYLEAPVRRAASPWALVGPRVEERAVRQLAHDLASGSWQARNAALLKLEGADLGARLLVAG
jgi:SAM-dependent methyltransferase